MGRNERQCGVLPRREFFNEQGLIFGASYESMAVVPDGTPPQIPNDPVTEYRPSARPGCRAPHVWLARRKEQISTIDLIGAHFLLLVGSEHNAWRRTAMALDSLWPPLVVCAVGAEGDVSDPDGCFHAAYGIDSDGAVLIRPDGHVAWRSPSGASNPDESLRAVFGHLLGRVPAGREPPAGFYPCLGTGGDADIDLETIIRKGRQAHTGPKL